MPRVLERFGPSFQTPGRTLRRLAGDVELLDGVQVRVSLWKEQGRAQRWFSLELLNGELVGVEVFIPLEAVQGEARKDAGGLENVILAT